MPKKELTGGEVEQLAESIYNILEDCPLYYLVEVLEIAKSYREKHGDINDLDVSDESESESEKNDSSSNSESESESD